MASDIRAADPEAAAGSGYAPIPASDVAGGGEEYDRRWLPGVLAAICGSLLLLAGLAAGLTRAGGEAARPSVPAAEGTPSRGVAEGVSEKAVRAAAAGGNQGYPWTNAMLTWQRTAFHFQPEKNWMNGEPSPMCSSSLFDSSL